jgi:hypothetical protein
MIHFFNPGHETAVLTGSPHYTPPANSLKMQHDLGYLPAWYADPHDYVWVYRGLPDDFLSLFGPDFPLPAKPLFETDLIRNKAAYEKESIVLWGISPQSVHYSQQLSRDYGPDWIIPDWKEEYLELTGRKIGIECLRDITTCFPEISSSLIPRVCYTLEEVEQLLENSSERLLAKAPYSSSGRGLVWLPEKLTETETRLLRGILKKQHYVLIEKVLDKKTDFAMEFCSDGKGKITFAGYSLFETNAKGAYLGNILHAQSEIVSRIVSFVDENILDRIRASLEVFLQKHFSFLYRGCIGVDMMVYREEDRYGLHPCVEINMRYNMGYLALHLYRRYVFPGSRGIYRIDFSSVPGEMRCRHEEMQRLHPPRVEEGRLKSGYFSLCPVNKTTFYRAYMWIESK